MKYLTIALKILLNILKNAKKYNKVLNVISYLNKVNKNLNSVANIFHPSSIFNICLTALSHS
jgi:hypothetical protein